MATTDHSRIHKLGRLLKFWNDENSLSVMLAILLIHLVVMTPLMHYGPGFQLAGALLITLGIIPSALELFHSRKMRILVSLLIACAAACKLIYHFHPLEIVGLGHKVSVLLSLVLLLYMVGVQLVMDGPVTLHRVRGAMAVYILIGVFFAYLYATFEVMLPGSFNLPADVRAPGHTLHGEAFYYFSIITLTTVGFGDISAIHPFARSLVMIEALVGQLYPAIIIARLVTMELETRRSGK